MEEIRYYYDILGISPSDDLILVTAAYKRLAKKYHPDTSLLPRSEAEEKFKAISEAYRFVRRAMAKTGQTEAYYGPSQAHSFTPAPSRSNSDRHGDNWGIICERHPRAKVLYEDLRKISPALSEEFKSIFLQDEYYGGIEEIASILEEEYLTRYFGNNDDIREFAKWLILNGHVSVALELNSEIVAVPVVKDSKGLIEKIIRRHNISDFGLESHPLDSRDRIDYVVDMTRKIGFWGSCLSVSSVASFVSGVLVASLFSGTRIERSILSVCLGIFGTMCGSFDYHVVNAFSWPAP